MRGSGHLCATSQSVTVSAEGVCREQVAARRAGESLRRRIYTKYGRRRGDALIIKACKFFHSVVAIAVWVSKNPHGWRPDVGAPGAQARRRQDIIEHDHRPPTL